MCFAQTLGFRKQKSAPVFWKGEPLNWIVKDEENWAEDKISLLGRGSTMGKGMEKLELMLHWEIKHIKISVTVERASIPLTYM